MSTSGVVTILFTDLVDSTESMLLMSAAEADVSRRSHFRLLTESITAHGGSVVKNLGDGLMAEFRSVNGALKASIAAQQRVVDYNQLGHELRIRMGLSTGEATEEEGDWFGLPVVEAARLCNTAEGGQILVSSTTRLLAGGSAATSLTSVGALALKGLPEPVEAYELAWAPLTHEETSVPLPARIEARSSVPFVGRATECAQLEQATKSAAAGQRRVTLLHAEPGMGKTRLASHAARRAHESGATVLYGRCDPELGLPYQPFVEALTHYVLHGSDRVLRNHVAACGSHVGLLVPDLYRKVPGSQPVSEATPETDRYRLFAAVRSLLHEAAASAPIVLLLDDLHWADKPTLLLLRHVLTDPGQMRVHVIVTYRDSETARSAPLVDLLTELAQEEGVERVGLKGLTEGEVVSLAEVTTGHVLDEQGVRVVKQIYTDTEGSPFFVAEILRHITESRGLVDSDGQWQYDGNPDSLGIPATVREVIRSRVGRLGDTVHRVLAMGSVIGREFDLDLLATVLGQSEDDLLDLLDDAVEASLLHERADLPGRFSFGHALIQHTLYDDLGPTRRTRAHSRIATALEAMGAANLDARLGEVAHHWLRTTAPADLLHALERGRQAGEQAVRQLAPDEAVRWFNQALDVVGRLGENQDSERCELLVLLGDAQRQAGDPAYRETLLRASALAEQLDDVPRMIRAALANNRGFVSSNGAVDDERVEVLERVLAAQSDHDSPDRPRLLILLAAELTYAGDWDRRLAIADEAVALARRVADPATLSTVLTTRFVAIAAPSTLAQRLGESTENLSLSKRLDDPAARFWALTFHATVSMEAGDIVSVDADLEEAQRLAASLGQPFLKWVSAWHRAWRTHVAGDCVLAEQQANAALAIALESGQPDAVELYAGQIFGIRRDQSQLAELLPLLADAERQNPGIPGFRSAWMLAACEAGETDGLAERLDAEIASGFADWRLDPLWLTGMAAYAEVAWWLGHRRLAKEVFARMEPWDGQVVFNSAFCQGVVAYHLGLLHAVLGRLDDADRSLIAADKQYEHLDAPLMRGRAQIARARVLRMRGAPGDLATAAAVAEIAAATAVRLAAPGIVLVPQDDALP